MSSAAQAKAAVGIVELPTPPQEFWFFWSQKNSHRDAERPDERGVVKRVIIYIE